ncbi:hypothetical protein [uncultured Mucilaginibacter sp.]|uniref:hypothetical protein n=1 Tax=uncultured Mucilaginibacter sp. TaxID=797541 RepID=UPI0025EB54C2|nr:hypothetical protein [uncultured Mucilaginibacter sp.]
MRFLPGLLALMLYATCSFAQNAPPEYFETGIIKTKFGARVAYTSRKRALTLDVASNQVKATEHPYVILVGTQVLQFAFTPVINDTLSRTPDKQKELVLGYVQSEVDYAKKILKADKLISTTEWLTLNNKPYLFWTYYLPEGDKSNVVKQTYLCTYSYGRVLSINSPLMKGEDELQSKALLTQVGKTFMQYNNYIDLEKMYKAMR